VHDQATAEVEIQQAEGKGAESEVRAVESGPSYRQPTQARCRKKFEDILDAAHALIDRNGAEKLSLYDIAQAADVATGSVYHFFPSVDSAFAALIDRYDQIFAEVFHRPIDPEGIGCWADIMKIHAESAYLHYKSNRPAMLLVLAGARVPDDPDPQEVMVRALLVAEGLWRLSVQRHGRLTREFTTEGLHALTAYMSLYVPTCLEPVGAASQDDSFTLAAEGDLA